MKKRMYCIRCGAEMELDFAKRWQKQKCPGCGVEFKYKCASEEDWTLLYKREDVEDLYVGDVRLVDLAAKAEA